MRASAATKTGKLAISMEQRNRVRYRLSTDAVFAWEGPQSGRLRGEGVTRDVSVAGAFIFTRTCPPVGAQIELEIFLSHPSNRPGRTVQIKTEAKVIRVEHSETAEGFAVVSQDFTLLFDSKSRNSFSVSSRQEKEREEKEETIHPVPTKARSQARFLGIYQNLSKVQ